MSQDEAALRSELDRINGLRFCGVWGTEFGDFAVFEDAAGTRTSFMLGVGETVGEGMLRVMERFSQSPA